jgi:hypothetical protein
MDPRTPVNTITKATCSLLLMLPLAACAKQEEPAKTQTNEQGCTRIRSIGPQDPYKDPPPLKQACLGPYLLEIPQNYFENQIGTEHDGLFALALEYPSLEPFKPGERMRLSADVSVRTVRVNYDYVDRIEVKEALRNAYAFWAYRKGPENRLETRIEGESRDGLKPYYVDMEKVRSHYLAEGLHETAAVMDTDFHTDWFIGHDAKGELSTVIKCTPRGVTESGVEYRDGKMVKNDVIGMARCDHTLMMEDINTIIKMSYPREGISQWQRIEARARQFVRDHMVKTRKEDK